MKIYLVHIGDIVKRWKLEYDVLLQHTNVDSFSSMLRSDLLHDDGRSELHGMELFSSITSQYEALTNDRLQKSIHTSQPEHLLIHLNVYKDQKGAQLCILGRKFNTSHGLSIGNRIIKIKEQEKAELGTGLVSWDGAVVLAKYLEKNFDLVNGKLVLELGAGTGIAGLAAWLLGAGEVSLTDLPYTIDNLHVNIQATREANEFPFSMHNIVAHKLDWTDPRTYPAQGQYDVLLGADIVWLEHLVDPLVRTIAHIIGSEGIMLLAHQVCKMFRFTIVG